MAVSSNMSQFYIENKGNQFFELGGFFFSSTMEMNASKQHPIVPSTLSTRFKDLVLTLMIYHTTLLLLCGYEDGERPSSDLTLKYPLLMTLLRNFKVQQHFQNLI